MPATLTAIAPAAGKPGDQVMLHGTGFAVGAVVSFAGLLLTLQDPAATVVSATQINTTVPEFDGSAQTLIVTVQNPGDIGTGAQAFNLAAYPAVENVFPLCSLSMVKQAIGLESTDVGEDRKLRRLIEMASSQLAGIVLLDIQSVTVTGELLDGDGTNVIYPARGPIQSVSALAIDGQAQDVTQLKVYADHVAFDDPDPLYYNPRLRLGSQVFPVGRQNIQITYTVGYGVVPRALAEACVIQVEFLMNTLSKQGLLSETNTVTSNTISWSQLPIAPASRIAANRYRRTQIGAV